MRYVVSIIVFFIVIALVQASLVYFAISSNNGLLEENSYERGLEYEQVIAELERGLRLVEGWELQRATDGSLHLKPRFTEASVPFVALRVSAKKPSAAREDVLAVAQTCEQQFCIEGQRFSSGLWLFDIETEFEGEVLRWKLRQVL